MLNVYMYNLLCSQMEMHIMSILCETSSIMMTSSNENIFRVTGPLCVGTHRSPVSGITLACCDCDLLEQISVKREQV